MLHTVNIWKHLHGQLCKAVLTSASTFHICTLLRNHWAFSLCSIIEPDTIWFYRQNFSDYRKRSRQTCKLHQTAAWPLMLQQPRILQVFYGKKCAQFINQAESNHSPVIMTGSYYDITHPWLDQLGVQTVSQQVNSMLTPDLVREQSKHLTMH